MDRTTTLIKKTVFSCLMVCCTFFTAHAQFFGQNQVRYKNEKFKVLQTPHFDIYYYIKNEKVLKNFAQDAETWYKMHQEIFRDTFLKKNPIILYSNHPDFQQTTTLGGQAPTVGTGGVTEAFKNRVVMPVLDLRSQTRHVLGHELVHAFQYHLLLEKDSLPLENVGSVPLWMTEGMAEYLSVGKKDAFTSMWMRDALLNRDVPSLKDLTNSNRYFPYRYGQAFWTFIGSVYGDTTIAPLFKNTARFGYENGIRYTFGFDDKTLSGLWKNEIEHHYRPMLKTDSSQIKIVGTKIVDNKNAANMNIAPAISPDGKYLAFLSEKDLFGIDLFLADAKTGQIIRKLSSQVSNSHIDDFNFLESAGTWSPDGKLFAFSIFSRGRNRLLIVDVKNGNTVLQTDMQQVETFNNLTWSPDGKEIAFSGMIEGQSDIFSYNLASKQITQLTNDEYADYAPNFSPDGSMIIFSSDRVAADAGNNHAVNPINLTVYRFADKSLTNLNVFAGANNLNAQFSGDSKRVFFLSNRDGFRNLYEYTLADGSVKQLTDYFTGISGITEFSPAITVSKNDDIIYSYYRYQRYTLYNAHASIFKATPIDINDVNFDAAILPPKETLGVNIINTNLGNFGRFERTSEQAMKQVPYKPKFQLDYLANSGVGVATSRFGTGVQGGIIGRFSDILGRNQIVANVSINGEIYDFGGMAGYINQQKRINWGFALSHVPYITGFRSAQYYTPGQGDPNNQLDTLSTNILRTFEDQAQLFASYPFNKIHRFEAGTSFSRYGYRMDRINDYYDNYGYLGSERERNRKPISFTGSPLTPFNVFDINFSFVGDNSIFGLTSPLEGFRYRIGAQKYFGDYKFFTVNLDARKYFRFKPVTMAIRTYNYWRIGREGQNLFPLFAGYNYLIRGYEANSFYNNNSATTTSGITIDQLSGNKLSVFNLEFRLPFTGPKKLSQIPSKFLISDLNVFFDAGLAWNEGNKVAFKSQPTYTQVPATDSNGNPVLDVNGDQIYNVTTNERVPAMSIGVSLRVNLFNAIILEPYYAIPFQRKDVRLGVFGVAFTPGW